MGGESLADEEVLELALAPVLGSGSAQLMADTLLEEYGSLGKVIAAPAEILRSLSGLGEAGMASLKLMQAGALRLIKAEVLGKPLLPNWDRLMDFLQATLAREQIEHFRVLYLDARSRLLADEQQGRGTINHAPVYPREVVKRALDLHAAALILVHNHPSGDPTPSKADIEITRNVAAAAELLSIALHDHIVVGNGRSFSFRQEGLLSGAARWAQAARMPFLGRVSEPGCTAGQDPLRDRLPTWTDIFQLPE